jgi:hypothetical protein
MVSLHVRASCQSIDNTTYSDEQSTDPVSYQQFYDALSPYGRWIDYPNYGYVWSPNIVDFRPYYSNGFWVNTDQGWCWNSGYSWGWAPFHYGRWFYEAGYGWLWVPGYEWAPAWVTWRTNADYYGWAPLPPGVSTGISVSFSIPFEHWSFVDHRYIAARDFSRHIIDARKNEIVYKTTIAINNFGHTKSNIGFAKGPESREVERFSGQKITPVTVREFHRPAAPFIDMDRREMKVYKPAVRQQQDQEVIRPANPVPYKSFSHAKWEGRHMGHKH